MYTSATDINKESNKLPIRYFVCPTKAPQNGIFMVDLSISKTYCKTINDIIIVNICNPLDCIRA